MSSCVRIVLLCVLAGAWLANAGTARAQDPVQASVDRAVVRDNESFTYVLRAEGAVRGDPDVGPLAAGFDVLDRSSSRRVGIVNGRASEVNEWQFQLMPRAPGDFTIPALRVGDRLSNPVTVRVLAPDPSAAPAADIFMELQAEPETVYAQAQMLFTLRLFIAVSTGRATLTAPETSGVEAIVEKLGEDAQYQTTRGTRNFVVRERRYAVFPQQAGALTIGPVTFEAMVIPDRGFSRVQRFRSDVLTIEVQPAVAPPPRLAGAAWLPAERVTLTEQWSGVDDELAVGVPRTRTIIVEGAGLLETQLPEVSVPQQDGVRQYADQPELEREITPQGFLSRRSVSLAVIAQTPGEITLAGVRVPWWNVATGTWEVAELAPRTLRVAPSAEAPAGEPVAAQASVEASAPVTEAQSFWPWLSALLALAWIVTVAAWWRVRTRPASEALTREIKPLESRPTVRRVLRDLDSACAVGDAGAARNALLSWAEVRFPAAPPRSLGALAARLPTDVAREVLALEAHIYGAAAGNWHAEGLRAALPTLEDVGAAHERDAEDPLLPLYR